jgi:2-polyprenyl-3-methyl-5-hydroxy-6-metoxy-1,4-benzoquinol methylase
MNKCLICESKEQIILKSKFKFVSSDIKKVKFTSDFFICSMCGCLQKKINKDYLKNVNKIYNYYTGFSKYDEIDQKKVSDLGISNRCDLLFKKFLNKKKYYEILDYGSSNGAMLMPFINLSKKLYATDLKCNLNSKILKNKNFIKFLNINNFKNSKKKYDLITMIHVLEHLNKPHEVLSTIGEKLKKKGIIFIQIPNFFLNPFDLSVYDHTIHFDIDSLFELAKVSNLKIIKIDKEFMNGEFSIILKKTNKKENIKRSKISILEKVNCFNRFKKNISNISKIKNMSILGTSISSLCIKHNFKGKINNFYDEDRSKIGKYFENKKIKEMVRKDERNLFLPFSDKKLLSVKKRIKKNYNYKLICWD